MDIAATVANGVSGNISDSGVSQAVAISTLKKAMDMDQEHATALIQSIPGNQSVPNLPPHLGNHVNTTA